MIAIVAMTIGQIFMRVVAYGLASSMEPVDRTHRASFQRQVGISPTYISPVSDRIIYIAIPPEEREGIGFFTERTFNHELIKHYSAEQCGFWGGTRHCQTQKLAF